MVSLHFWLRTVLHATTACTFWTSQLPKVVQQWCVSTLLTSKCASRHDSVHFLNTSTANSVLRATTACTFSTSQLPKVVRQWCVSTLLTSKCASRHNGVHFLNISTSKCVRQWCVSTLLASKCALRHKGVQFFISHLPRWLRTCHFREPTFRPSGATKLWKNTVLCDFSTFSRTCIFFLLTLSLLWLFPTAFPSVNIVGSLTSRLLSKTLIQLDKTQNKQQSVKQL